MVEKEIRTGGSSSASNNESESVSSIDLRNGLNLPHAVGCFSADGACKRGSTPPLGTFAFSLPAGGGRCSQLG